MHTSLRVLFATVPLPGHVNPGLPIARGLVELGHDVVWYTGRAHRHAVEATGARFVPTTAAHDPADASLDERFSGRAELEGLAALRFDFKHLFLDEVPGQIEDLRRILADFPADVVVADTAFLAAPVLHEHGGPPYATYGISILPIPSRDIAPLGIGRPPARSALGRRRDWLLGRTMQRLLFRDVQRHHQQIRRRVGLEPTDRTIFDLFVSPYLYMHASVASFEYPRRDLPLHVHFIGPLLPDSPVSTERPAWWHELGGDRPVVLVTQGTVAVDLDDLVSPVLDALAADEVVVIATGGDGTLSRPIPANAHVEAFVPFAELLPHVDVMVTNGGFGGVQFALAHGVPLVVAGTTEDKPEIAARVAWSGVGINLGRRRPTATQLGDAVRSVLADSRYGDRAQRMRQQAEALDASATAAQLIEQLARSGQAVHRLTTPTSAPLPAAAVSKGTSP